MRYLSVRHLSAFDEISAVLFRLNMSLSAFYWGLDDLKDVIQHLFEIQSAVHGYLGSETQQELVRKM